MFTLHTLRKHYILLRMGLCAGGMAFLLSACGGGSTGAVSMPLVQPQPEPPQGCVNQVYKIDIAFDDGNFIAGLAPENAIDGDTTLRSRWENDGANQALILDLGTPESLGALTIKWLKGAEQIYRFSVDTSLDNNQWNSILSNQQSSGRHSGFELVKLDNSTARYVRITALGNSANSANGIIEVQAHSCEEATGQYNDLFPNELGIELVDWYLSVPTDDDDNGKSDSIFETELANGYTNSEFFYASADNGIVMRSPSYGFKTSQNTQYVRVELREMLRRGDRTISTQGVNKNNWVFSSASGSGQANAGGVDGELKVTMAVNQVTTTGENYQIGRVIIGQIHANDDEPVRLYYRKLPDNSRGAIYFAHESRVEDSDGDNIETYVEMIGSRSNSASNPVDGIALDEKFSYQINVNVSLLTVTISRDGKNDVVANYDMSESLYDQDSQYHYFKVGVYHVNNSSVPEEYAQATFYQIKNSHTGYAASE